LTVALKNLISTIPTLSEAEFAQLVETTFSRMSNQGRIIPLSEEEWAEKLGHSLVYARQGQKSGASTLITRIRTMYR